MIVNFTKGMMYGLAIGDALGAANEFKQPGTFDPIEHYAPGPHPISPGMFTDDTSMALAMADSIGQKGWDLYDQMTRYCKWYREGKYSPTNECFDIGGTTCTALQNFERGAGPSRSGLTGQYDSGNGGIMRLAPAVIFGIQTGQWGVGRTAFDWIVESSLPTHATGVCKWAALMLGSACGQLATYTGPRKKGAQASVLHEAYYNATRYHVSFCSFRFKEDENCQQIADTMQGLDSAWCAMKFDALPTSGYALHTLLTALQVFVRTNSFKDCVLTAANLGGDSDTIAAVAGQLAGAWYGYHNIDDKLIKDLYCKDMIDKYLNPLLITE